MKEYFLDAKNISFSKPNLKIIVPPGFLNKGLSPENISVRVGRNDLCPCGSGIKYKKCCGK